MWTGWSGVGDGVGDTPQTAMTTRAPAVLKTGTHIMALKLL